MKRLMSGLAIALCLLLGLSGVALATSPSLEFSDLDGVFEGSARIRLTGHDSTRVGETVTHVSLNLTGVNVTASEGLVVSSWEAVPYSAAGTASFWIDTASTESPDKTVPIYGLVGNLGDRGWRSRVWLSLWSTDDLTGGNLNAFSYIGTLRHTRDGDVHTVNGQAMIALLGDPGGVTPVPHTLGRGGLRLTFTPTPSE